MFGKFDVGQLNKKIEKVHYQMQNDSRYKSFNNNQVSVIDTALGRAYINADSYFSNVPESVWESAFEGEKSPKQLLESKIGAELTNNDILEFQQLLEDLIDAEFKSKNQTMN